MTALKYLGGYPSALLDKVRLLIERDELGAYLEKRHPGRHEVQSDKALYAYTNALRQQHLRNAPGIDRVWYDSKLDVIGKALGLHTAISHVHGSRLKARHPYDDIEHGETTLRSDAEIVNGELRTELNERLSHAGILVDEAGLTHLAYASEIAGAMLRRQQAEAVIAARAKLVMGAVSMVEMALDKLNEGGKVHLDDERRAAMVSNLMVVLCGERDTQPVVNTGTLYQ